MTARQNPAIKNYDKTFQGGTARDIYPIPLETTYTISGARENGDVDECFILRRGHRITRISLYASDGLADADANVEFGIIAGEIGATPSTTSTDSAALRRAINGGGLSLNTDNISNELDKVYHSAEMRFDIDEANDRAVGFKWGAAVTAPTTALDVKLVIEVEVPSNSGIA